MRVKSDFAGFFSNRLVVTSIVIFAVFFIASSFTDHSDRDLRAKQMNLIIRQIGHRLMLQAGDSTSRVLPVTEIKKGTFKLSFENEFIFNHDSLMALSKSLLPKAQFPSGYTVTVHDCITGGMVYGFQLNNTSPDILACSGRSQPPGCYTIEFSFPGFYENLKNTIAEIGQGTEETSSGKVDLSEVNPKHEELRTTTPGNEIDRQTKDLKSVKADQQEVNPGGGDFETAAFDYTLISVVFGSIVLLLGITLLIRRFGKILKPGPVQNHDHGIIQDQTIIQDYTTLQEHTILPAHTLLQDYAIINESVPELPLLGKFLFNVKDQRLLLGSEVINLTDKECKVLDLLHKNFGELIPRETLMDEVWIKEGVITGRSLDMFVSKLRKKLSPDPELRITNVHGKGYKLEIPL